MAEQEKKMSVAQMREILKAQGVRNTSVMRKAELQKLMAEMGLLEDQSEVLEKDKEQPAASDEKGPEQNVRSGQNAQKERSVRSGQNAQKEQSARSGQNAQKEQNARNDRHIQMADCTVAEEIPTVSAARTTSGMRMVSVTKTASAVRIINVMTAISGGIVANGWMFTRKMSISSQMRKVKSQVMVS